MKYSLLNAIVYEICRIFVDEKPTWRGNKWVKMIMDHCFPDWVEWKTELTMKDVDRQTEEIKNQWQKEENQVIVEKFQEVYPEAKVTTHDPVTGSVLIEHPPDGSQAQDLLGGAMEIRSPWSLPESK